LPDTPMEYAMIRPAAQNDIAALMTLADLTGLFPPDELVEIGQMLDDHLGDDASGNHCWITDEEDGELVGVAYYAPERMTDGTWNLYLIAVKREGPPIADEDREGQVRCRHKTSTAKSGLRASAGCASTASSMRRALSIKSRRCAPPPPER
jgi:hypothetical protein